MWEEHGGSRCAGRFASEANPDHELRGLGANPNYSLGCSHLTIRIGLGQLPEPSLILRSRPVLGNPTYKVRGPESDPEANPNHKWRARAREAIILHIFDGERLSSTHSVKCLRNSVKLVELLYAVQNCLLTCFLHLARQEEFVQDHVYLDQATE